MTESATGKLYAELPGVKIRKNLIPGLLHEILDDAKTWAIVGETGIEKAIKKATIEDMERVVSAARPIKDEIWRFAFESQGASQTPIPDEVVLFQIFVCVLGELESTVTLIKSRKRSTK
jgi:hypothetical protein